jgi:KaiC/GvpD/RAD55 family RecA-like ATPase
VVYSLGAGLEASVDPGTNLLVTGPPLTGKRALAFDVLGTGSREGEGAVVVTTQDDATRTLEAYEERVPPGTAAGELAVIDAVSRHQGTDELDDDRIGYVSSPVDLTGLGIELSEVLQAFYADRGIERNRVLFHSLSTLLMYSELRTVFRFLHVTTGRIQSVDGLGLFCIDSTAHEDRTTSTLKQLFDGVVETAEGTDPTLRI